jgi:hypothetical protein
LRGWSRGTDYEMRFPGRSDHDSVVLELRLDSGFAADAYHICRRLLGSEGTVGPTGAGPAHLRAAAVCSPRHKYFQ